MMAFEDIECINPAPIGNPKVSPAGVAVAVRRLGRPKRAGGGHVSYIRVTIGAGLARAIALKEEAHQLRLLFGTAEDAGKVQVSADQEAGKFLAKRDKQGNYALSINAATADGLFSLAFPAFAEERCTAGAGANGRPPSFIFRASKEMLEVEED